MSDVILFAIGFVVFSVPTTATLWFGYQRFNHLYRKDMATDPDAPVLVVDGNDFEYRIPRGHPIPAKLGTTADGSAFAGS